MVEVKDYGVGILPEHKENIFDKYFSYISTNNDHSTSTGLGLTFCKLVIEAHKQTISVESELNKGSSFWFTLKFSRKESKTKQNDIINKKINTDNFEEIKEKLRDKEIYETGDIFAILDSCTNKTTQFFEWKNQIKDAILNQNEEFYKNLIK
jgi:hypothetical protein